MPDSFASLSILNHPLHRLRDWNLRPARLWRYLRWEHRRLLSSFLFLDLLALGKGAIYDWRISLLLALSCSACCPGTLQWDIFSFLLVTTGFGVEEEFTLAQPSGTASSHDVGIGGIFGIPFLGRTFKHPHKQKFKSIKQTWLNQIDFQ